MNSCEIAGIQRTTIESGQLLNLAFHPVQLYVWHTLCVLNENISYRKQDQISVWWAKKYWLFSWGSIMNIFKRCISLPNEERRANKYCSFEVQSKTQTSRSVAGSACIDLQFAQEEQIWNGFNTIQNIKTSLSRKIAICHINTINYQLKTKTKW